MARICKDKVRAFEDFFCVNGAKQKSESERFLIRFKFREEDGLNAWRGSEAFLKMSAKLFSRLPTSPR